MLTNVLSKHITAMLTLPARTTLDHLHAHVRMDSVEMELFVKVSDIAILVKSAHSNFFQHPYSHKR